MKQQHNNLRIHLLLILLLVSFNASALDVINIEGKAANQALSELEDTLKNEPNNIFALKNAGILLHQMSRKTPDEDAVKKSESYLKKVISSQPKDYEAQAWLGSVITMKALFEKDPGKQTFFVKLGTRKMDKAVKKTPNNLIVRLIRANNSMELPPFLKRTRFAVTDFEYYLEACKTENCSDSALQHARLSLAEAKKIVMEN